MPEQIITLILSPTQTVEQFEDRSTVDRVHQAIAREVNVMLKILVA